MRNPFRSEADAYRLVWLTVGYFALIVVGALINVWVGVAVFIVETVLVVWWVFLRRGEAAQPAREAPVPHGDGSGGSSSSRTRPSAAASCWIASSRRARASPRRCSSSALR